MKKVIAVPESVVSDVVHPVLDPDNQPVAVVNNDSRVIASDGNSQNALDDLIGLNSSVV